MNGTDAPLVRPLARADRSAWAPLWRAYLDFYETTLPDSHYNDLWARLMGDDPHDFNGLCAEVDGRIVGITHYLFHRHAWRPERVCYLQDLYADPSVRRTGVGRALIEGVYAAADAEGAPSVYWMTQEFNSVARVLYDRVGARTPFIRYTGGAA